MFMSLIIKMKVRVAAKIKPGWVSICTRVINSWRANCHNIILYS